MKVLVTGADGYIGDHADAAASWSAATRSSASTSAITATAGSMTTAAAAPPIITKDIRDIGAADVAGFDAVVHLAELSNDPLAQHDPRLTYAINHRGSVALARLCRDGRRARASSTPPRAASMARRPTARSAPRTSPLNPQTAYAVCKTLVERDVQALAGDGFSPVFLRNATAYGPEPEHALRHRAQRPRRPCLDQRRGQGDERRHAVAAARPCRGYRPGDLALPRGAARGGAQPDLQCRRRRAELYVRAIAEIVAVVLPRRAAELRRRRRRQPQLPRRLRQDPAPSARFPCRYTPPTARSSSTTSSPPSA